MAFDDPDGKRIFNCASCGNDYRASPPDDEYTFAKIKKCWVCDALFLSQYVKRTHECDNCHKQNTLYWHINYPHNPLEISRAKQKTNSLDFLTRKF